MHSRRFLIPAFNSRVLFVVGFIIFGMRIREVNSHMNKKKSATGLEE